MTFYLTEEAKKDLIQIYTFGVHHFGELQAENYFNGFFIAFNQIANSPFSYQKVYGLNRTYRRKVYGSDSIYYRVVEDKIEIIRIIGQQDFP